MSLIHRQTTEAAAAASRANGMKSAGPETGAGKLRARMNALEHGMRAEVGVVLPELCERPDDLQEIVVQMWHKYSPKDDFEAALLEQMAENRWRRRRVLRAESGLLLAHRLHFDLDRSRAQAGESRSASSTGEAALAQQHGLTSVPDSAAKFSFILECLRVAGRLVEQEGFSEAGLKRLEAVYGPNPGLAGAALLSTYRECQKPALTSGDSSSPLEGQDHRSEFLALLEAEITSFQKLQDLHEASHNELVAAQRETLNILPSNDLNRILRYEGFLDRQYDRLLRQLQHCNENKNKDCKDETGW